ncbi:MAG TPA: hypothetical protein VFW38_10505 [Solirubrobacteraceae bacterium]|nr:hypothetical protein [Solirubrobacteraceae bacterium]
MAFPSETLLIHPEYSKCEINLAGTHLAAVTTTGCNYVFHAAEPDTQEGTVDVECEAGDEIKVHVSGLNCEIKVPAQSGLKTIEYVNNEDEGSITLNADILGIVWTSNCTQLEKSSGNEGEYREGQIVEETPEMGAGPATATTEPKEDEGGILD